MKEKIELEILTAANELNAVKPDQVALLVENNLRFDGEGYAVDAKGRPRYSADGRRLGSFEVVSEFLKRNPHFVKQ